MRRILILFCLMGVLGSAAFAQDDLDGACLVAPADIVAQISETETVVWRSSGGAQIYDASVPVLEVSARTTANGRLRRTPDSSADNVFTVVESGGALDVLGRDESGSWIYVAAPKNDAGVMTGWVSTQVAAVDGGVSALPVVSTENPPSAYPPFQAVRIPAESCSDSEAAGALVQSSEEDYSLVVVNDVEIELSGTAFVRPIEEAVTVNLLAGRAIVADHYLPPGASATVSADSTTVASYSDDVVAVLPLGDVVGSDFSSVEPAPALPEEGIDAAVKELYAPHGLVDGLYDVWVTRFVRTKPEGYIDGYCFSGGTVLSAVYVRNGAMDSVRSVPNIISMTEFSFENSYEDERTGCIVGHYARLAR